MTQKQYYIIFDELATEEEMNSLQTRMQLAIEYERSLTDEQKAKLFDYTDVDEMLREID